MWIVCLLPAKSTLINGVTSKLSIMYTYSDVIGLHAINELIAGAAALASLHHNCIEVKRMASSGFNGCGKAYGKIRKCFLISTPDFFSSTPVTFNSFDLVDTNSCLEVHHIEFEAHFKHFIMFVTSVSEALPCVSRHTVKGKDLDSGSNLVIVG